MYPPPYPNSQEPCLIVAGRRGLLGLLLFLLGRDPVEVVQVHLAHAARPERLVRADRAPEGLRTRVDPHVRLQTGLKDLQNVAKIFQRLREIAMV